MGSKKEAEGSDRSGTALLKAGLFISTAGLILLVVRLMLGDTTTFGLLSNALIIISGVVIAWKSLRRVVQKSQ
ncbi:hypothetical protein [Corynebacterium occultum]|uniref:hypothetical protein n=1 Tax=Corynebacterium occultum TaxID=2675219 RepID=UPI0012E25F95|nr:hypothetical protein [Corynebacterium occultum]